MNWNSVSEFLAMGGYGPYVWGTFGATALLLAAEMLSLHLRRRALKAPIAAMEPIAGHVVDYQGAGAGSHPYDHGVPNEA